MTEAEQFLAKLGTKDSNAVYSALEDAAGQGEVGEYQDWNAGRSVWTFEDRSAIVMEGADVTAIDGNLGDDAIRELCILTTRDNAGKHFTEWAKHWEQLEYRRLIEVDRPVHGSTGIPYGQEHWTLKVTEEGQETVDASVRYHVNEEDAPAAPAGWYLLWPEGAGWDAVRIGDDGDVIGTISEAGAQNHINARDRLAGIVEAIRSESTESVDTAVAEAIVWAWDTDADPACVVVERIVTS